jgi:putative ABC transport system substrate-binding protein
VLGGAAAVLAGLSPFNAQTQSTPIVIGRVHPGSLDATLRSFLRGFDNGMRALGHIEGRTYRQEARFAEGDPARLREIAEQLAREKVDIIVASGTVGVRAAKMATRTIPIVMAMSGPDPVGSGLIGSLARPGENVTGLTGQTDELPIKQLELLREMLPRLRDVLVLSNPQGSTRPNRPLSDAASMLGLRLHTFDLARPEDLEQAFARPDLSDGWAAIALADPAIIDRLRAPMAALALRHRLPLVQSFRAGVEAGGLLCYGIDLADMHRRSAFFVDKILKGARPADIPVERPTKFELVINLKTARLLGVAIPTPILQRADDVIE